MVRLWLALCQLVSAVSANCGSLYESRAAMWRSMSQAHDESLACQVNEGRHWELELDVRKLYDAVRISDRPSFMIRAANAFNIALPTQRSELPQHLRLCLCVPATCAAEEVVETVFAAQFAVEFMGDEPKRLVSHQS